LRYNDAGFLEHTIGMPQSHLRAFLQVARSEQVVIMVRATGPTCHGLLEEGYDTKGYRIHGKSCDWGPMAGFVVRDPRLNKYGTAKESFNRDKHREALYIDHEGQGWKAGTTPLIVSKSRVDWLRTRKLITVTAVGADRLDGHAKHQSGIAFNFSLIKLSGDTYGVYFDNSKTLKWAQERGRENVQYHPKWGANYEQMLAMTNPSDHGIMTKEPRFKAITGDYDLFAVWPFVGSYDPGAYGLDHRPLGTVKGSIGKTERSNVDMLERNFTKGGQGTKLGNITPRIYMVCQLINSIVGRHVLWHSDEAARPFLDDVDLPVLAVTPRGNYVGIEDIFDFKVFISFCNKEGIKVTLSNAWAQDPTDKHKNRLGAEFSKFVPADGARIIVPDYYNR
jgi:hypothetical protein